MGLSIADKTNPKPILGDKIVLQLRDLKNVAGSAYDLSGVSKFYCTIKDSLDDADAAAILQLNSGTAPTQFTTTYASTGNLDVILLPANTATGFTADTTYYIDVKAIWSATEIVTLVYDTIVFANWDTRATS